MHVTEKGAEGSGGEQRGDELNDYIVVELDELNPEPQEPHEPPVARMYQVRLATGTGRGAGGHDTGSANNCVCAAPGPRGGGAGLDGMRGPAAAAPGRHRHAARPRPCTSKFIS